MLFHAGLKIPFRCVPVRKTAQITQVRSESETLIVGNLRSPLCQRRLLQSHVPSSQKGRRYETGYRSKLTESIHRNTTFPDGTSFLDKNPPTTGVLHDKIGPKGCISFGCNSSTISKIPSVLLENQNLSFQSTPLRPKHSSNDLHSVNETSSELLTETRCPSGNLPRRYVDYRSISGRDKSVHGNGNSVIGVLGFIINKEKSIMTPTQVIQFLGFIINSNTMMILLPQEKVNKLQTLCRQILRIEKPALRSIAQLLGLLESYRPAIWKALLHFRFLQALLIRNLHTSDHNYETKIQLPGKQKVEIQWWFQNIMSINGTPITVPPPDVTIYFPMPRNRGGGQSRAVTKPTENGLPPRSCYTSIFSN